jgi:formylglycine-generating enzyme required for sulfatase activity
MRTIKYHWPITNGDSVMEMAFVDGTAGHPYWFGNGSETRQIEVRGFWIGTVPVTRALWMHVMGSKDCPAVGQGVERPLENVSWDGLTGTGRIYRTNECGHNSDADGRASGTANGGLPPPD